MVDNEVILAWLDDNNLQFDKIVRSSRGLSSRVILEAARKVYEDRDHIKPIRIVWNIMDLAKSMPDPGFKQSLRALNVEDRLERLEYLVWNLRRPFLERYMDGTFIFGSW